jgi:hypothetical protein
VSPRSAVQERPATTTAERGRLAHLVLKPDWPRALCGFIVTAHLGTAAPAMDRCLDCLKVAAERRLGRPGWREAT